MNTHVNMHKNQEEEEKNRLLVEIHPNLSEGYGCVMFLLMVDAAIGTILPVCCI